MTQTEKRTYTNVESIRDNITAPFNSALGVLGLFRVVTLELEQANFTSTADKIH